MVFLHAITAGSIPPPGSLAGTPLFSMADSGLSVLASAAAVASYAPTGRPISAASPLLSTGCVAPPQPPGIGIGDVPEKMKRRIWDLDHIEIGELLPDTWNLQQIQQDQGLHCCHQAKTSRRAPVTNLLLWLEGYSIMVAVLATKFPQYIGEFMAYQRRIIWAASNFEGTAWVTYDSCYRRRAATKRSLNWSVEDTTLSQEAFAGRARAISRCAFCLSRLHTSAECLLAPEPPSHQARPPVASHPWRPAGEMGEVCGLFNKVGGNECRYKWCKYAHRCRLCSQGHPMSACPLKSNYPPTKRSLSPFGGNYRGKAPKRN